MKCYSVTIWCHREPCFSDFAKALRFYRDVIAHILEEDVLATNYGVDTGLEVARLGNEI